MKIMHLSNHCGKANGHVNVSVDMACTQSRMGHQVAYTSCGGDYVGLMESNGVTIFHAPEPHRSIAGFIAAARAIRRAVKTFKPDIIHIHMAAQSVMTQPLRLIGYKTVTTVHNEFDRSVFLMRLATRVITISQAGAEGMRRRMIRKSAVHTVLNGPIGSPRLPPNFTPAQTKRPAIMTVCGMHPRKGVPDLLHAMQQVLATNPDASLYLLGEGPMLNEYKNLAQTLNISEHVEFLGFLPDPRPYYAAVDIFVLASHAEPAGLVIAEARHAGCAIIATKVGGIPEMLDFGAAGTLVEPHQPQQIAAAIISLLNNPAERANQSKRAKNNAERFTIARVCHEIDEIYSEIAIKSNASTSGPAKEQNRKILPR